MIKQDTSVDRPPPRVSVIICVYNRPAQIVTCLDSILASNMDDYEIVVIDDGSTDRTPNVLADYTQNHPDYSFRVIRNPHNRGVSAARNVGSREARGNYILFTDSDCTVAPDWLSHMLTAMLNSEAAAGAGTVIDAAPSNLAEWAAYGTTRIGQKPWQGRGLVGNNMIFRRDVLQAHAFDESLVYYCDDDEMAWRLQREGYKITFEPRAVVYHNHAMTIAKYLRHARSQGVGSARYWYKRGTYIGRDLWFMTAAVATLPSLIWQPSLWPVPFALLMLQILALAVNEVLFKGKSVTRAILVLPLVSLHSAIKAFSVYATLIKILLGIDHSVRRSNACVAD